MPKRDHTNIAQGKKTCYFYAPLTNDFVPSISHNGDYTVYKSTGSTMTNDGVYVNGRYSGLMWNCTVPNNTNITFNCWFKFINNNVTSYAFGAATKDNRRYAGCQYATYQNYWLICEWLYLCPIASSIPRPHATNTWVYISFTIIYNGNNSYTFKFYKNGVFVTEKTLTDNTWLKLQDCYFAFGHFVDTLTGYYKHFSCFDELSESEILTLYQNGGIVS
ncbi:MAG: hypothetical protein J6Y35_07105 [Bacteroidales bacterium]|nr:hypothetical protein [Bacteroidales bacterium]